MMKFTFKLIPALALLTLASFAQADLIVCSEGPKINALNERLDQIVLSPEQFEKVVVFEGWGTNEQSVKTRFSDNDIYVKVQFPEYSDEESEADAVDTAWIPKRLIKEEANCSFYQEQKAKDDEIEAGEENTADSLPAVTPSPSSNSFLGLKDPKCCKFPLFKAPTNNMAAGAARFGANRRLKAGGTRLHAGVDLYQANSSPIRAVADGEIIDFREFYQSTWQITVLHAGGFVIRYGEVQPSLAAGLSKGSRVKMGQAIGAIKKTVCCTPMLHFETYTGSSTGPLSVIGVNRFNRRADIIDGTPHLRKWRRSL